jgi:hypothetical protein
MFAKLLYFIILYFAVDFLSLKNSFWIIILFLISLILVNIIYLNWKAKNFKPFKL